MKFLDGRKELDPLVVVSFGELGCLPFLEVRRGASGSSLASLPFWESDTEYLLSSVSAYCVPLRSPL